MIKVLIVDDSILFRNVLARALGADENIKVVAAVEDPFQARDAIIKYQPDVMTLDLEMPRMGGLEFLQKLMPQHPIPTVVISSLSDKVFDCLKAGAVDFVAKPAGMNMMQLEKFVNEELLAKIKVAVTAKVNKGKLAGATARKEQKPVKSDQSRLIAIGASTGGTEAICQVIQTFTPDMPGTVIVQHMPPGFTKMYADRLNNICKVKVKEAETGDRVEKGTVLIAPGDKQMRVVITNGQYQVECRAGEKVSGHCPSVDVLFDSVARTAGENAIGVILTGMGGDGAKGLLNMRKEGALTIGQDENSCVVYGMPRVAYELGAVKYQLPLENIGGKIYSLLPK